MTDTQLCHCELCRMERINVRLRNALQLAFDCLITMRFEPDAGKPHPMKDGIYDHALDTARDALHKS